MLALRQFLTQLKQPVETPIEPELKADKQDKDRRIREEQDLSAGAVLEAVIADGQGTDSPQQGDLVYVHYSVCNAEGDLLYSTQAGDGGSGQPLAFLLEKGQRAPRAWELALQGMTQGACKRVKVQPHYGYQHSSCKMAPPDRVPAGEVLHFDLQLVNWYPAKQVRVCGEESDMFKRVLLESDKWEMARPPNEVTFSLEARTLAYNGHQCTGYQYYSVSADNSLQVQLGQGLLPSGLEAALGSMSKGEKAVFVLPALQMQPPSYAPQEGSSDSNGDGSNKQQPAQYVLPPPPAKAAQVEVCLQLHDLVQVRDMTGDGQVTKKRLLEGQGEFPVDCPLHDTTVRLHYRVRSLANGQPGPWLHDSKQAASSSTGEATSGAYNVVNGTATSSSSDDAEQWRARGGTVTPVEADTGCGELPEGLEMCIKLMVPGEVANARCQPKYAYQNHPDIPPGLDPTQPVEFQVQLISFEREGYWQNLGWAERWALAERIKEKGNALFKQKKYHYAHSRYTHLLRLIESTRDFEEQEQVEKADAYKATLLSNLALVTFQQGEYARCIEWCDKALQGEPDNAKVMFRKGKALSMKGDYEEADEHLAAAAEMDDSITADVEATRAANKQRAKAAQAKQKQDFKPFFS
eukprot:GHRR01003190.1.p1 GENE.GHRR01003190.1~~GHRR01003190.1.p1  ORF type:complete len:634 (+),score=228.22 GHRR01003190.1:2740-4641(+)